MKYLIKRLRDTQYQAYLDGDVDMEGLLGKAAEALEQQEWISVKDRLPDKDGWYLCIIRSSAFRGACYHTILPYDKAGFRTGYVYTDDVTHWMPLPEPPKGE